MNSMLWLGAAVVPLILVASIATCLARPDWVRGLRSCVARVRWAKFQYAIKHAGSKRWPKEEIESLFREYFLHKGGGDVGERMTALRELSALGGGARRDAVCELAERILDRVRLLPKEGNEGASDKSTTIVRDVLGAMLGETSVGLDDLRGRLAARAVNQVELLELLLAVQICLEAMPITGGSIPPVRQRF